MKHGRQRRWAALALALLLALLPAASTGGGGPAGSAAPALPAGAPAALAGGEGEESGEGPKLAALTFDDGPRRATTTKLLDGLERRGAHCTFFVVGSQIAGNEDILRRMDAQGHQLGLHTYDHVPLTDLSAADFACQVERGREALKAAVGHNDFVLRPPYGLTDRGVEARAGCPIILWSVDPADWDDRDTGRVVEQVVAQTRDGDIILLHDIYDTSVEAALQIVDALHQRGFYLVTVEELARERAVALEPGKVYREFRP